MNTEDKANNPIPRSYIAHPRSLRHHGFLDRESPHSILGPFPYHGLFHKNGGMGFSCGKAAIFTIPKLTNDGIWHWVAIFFSTTVNQVCLPNKAPNS